MMAIFFFYYFIQKVDKKKRIKLKKRKEKAEVRNSAYIYSPITDTTINNKNNNHVKENKMKFILFWQTTHYFLNNIILIKWQNKIKKK